MRLWSPVFSVRPSEMRASSFFSHSTWNTNQTRVYLKLFFFRRYSAVGSDADWATFSRNWGWNVSTHWALHRFSARTEHEVVSWGRTFNSRLKNFHHCLGANLKHSTQPSLISATATFRAPQKHSHSWFACEHSSAVAFFLWFTASCKSLLYCFWPVNMVRGSWDVWMQSHFNNPARFVWNIKNGSFLVF